VLGLDGLDPDVVRALGPERLPQLFALAERGVFARLLSVLPAATLPNWTTFLTCFDPGVHGVFDFTTRVGDRVRFTGGTVRAEPTVFARLDAAGWRCACIGFPGTWPPERLRHGVFVSGWDSPVAFEADRSFVWPPELYEELRARSGGLRFDDVDELAADTPGWHSALADALVARIARKRELASWLLGERDWDVFACYFGESDTAAHYLWSQHDPGSPRRPHDVSPRDADGLARVYAALDETVGALVARAGGDEVEVTIVSDHGAGGTSDRALYLNRALADAGLCVLREGGLGSALTRSLKESALVHLPPRARALAFRAAGSVLPGWLESRSRFAELDFRATQAFSEELNYFPSVWLNVRGREPLGTIDARDVPRARARVREALLALRDPWDGTPVVRAVHAREDLYAGPLVDRAPDLVLELALPGGYSYNVLPSASAPPRALLGGTGAFRRLRPSEYLGRKGRSLPGSHRSHGVFFAAGPSVRPRVDCAPRMADATATLLARLGVALPAGAAGRVLGEILRDGAAGPSREAVSLPVVSVESPLRAGAGDEARVEARLRALGYLD
jgi:predicted AlkP superfamily phosphohydrolase/phosphomutase